MSALAMELGAVTLGGAAAIWAGGRVLLGRFTVTQWTEQAQADVDSADRRPGLPVCPGQGTRASRRPPVPRKVRTYTRRNPAGGTTTVHQHTRRGNPFRPEPPRKKRGPNPGHAVKLGRRARVAKRKGRKYVAAGFALLAAGEVAAWLTLSTTASSALSPPGFSSASVT